MKPQVCSLWIPYDHPAAIPSLIRRRSRRTDDEIASPPSVMDRVGVEGLNKYAIKLLARDPQTLDYGRFA